MKREPHPLAGKTVILKCQDFHHLLDKNFKKQMESTIQMYAPDLNGFLFKVHDWLIEDEDQEEFPRSDFFHATHGYSIRRGFFIEKFIGLPPEEKKEDIVVGKLLEKDHLIFVHNSELGEVVSN